ncbi:MAG TPA: type II toxin-antitoxin system HicA family toxin [Longimicrobium sp.]|nr:type II toxin-antitoxin system HicA family toxin [Longimicrobium sp.]
MTTVCRKRLDEARANVTSLRFGNLCALAECFGWVFVRQSGSHRMYKRSGSTVLMNFQEDRNGRAKPYQVRQMLAAIDELSANEDA